MSGETPPPLRALLFDMDGVLVDSFEAWLAVLNAVAARLGAPPVSRARLREAFGQGVDEDARTLFPGSDAAALRAAYDREMPRHVGRMRVNPEARAVLQDLRARGVATALVTNTQTSLAEAIVAACGLDGALDCVSAAEPPRREKPHPDLVLDALERLGVATDAALLVGDTDYDERAARAAGVRYLFYDMRSGASLRAAVHACLGNGRPLPDRKPHR